MPQCGRCTSVAHVTYETLTFERREHLGLVGLNRAAKRNAFNLAMLSELALAYGEYERDADLRCLVVFAHGDHFTAGLDLAEVGPQVASGANLFPESGVDPLDLFQPRREKPVVMVAQGYCFTIGIELMLGADVCVAASDARFAQMEVKRGIMAFGGATLRLPRLGWGDAMRWLLTGDTFDAAEALRIGLVQEVAPRGEELARAVSIALAIAARAPLAVRASRNSARAAVERGQAAALEELMSTARSLMDSEDAREGVLSFLERRDARFVGR